MKKDRERKERLSGEERRTRILDAALMLFADKGFSGTKTREVAKQAGISETLVFRHFGTKRGLYNAVYKWLSDHRLVIPEIEEKMAKKDDAGVFSTVAIDMIKHSRQYRRVIRLSVFRALEHPRFAKFFRRRRETTLLVPEFLGRYIQQRVDEGAFKSVNAEIAARLFTGMVVMYILDQEASIIGPPFPFSDEEATETLVRIFLDGLKT